MVPLSFIRELVGIVKRSGIFWNMEGASGYGGASERHAALQVVKPARVGQLCLTNSTTVRWSRISGSNVMTAVNGVSCLLHSSNKFRYMAVLSHEQLVLACSHQL